MGAILSRNKPKPITPEEPHKTAVIVGVSGALGSSLTTILKKAHYRIIGISSQPTNADVNLSTKCQSSYIEASKEITQKCKDAAPLVDAVICVAGGWKGASVGDADAFDSLQTLYEANMKPAILAAHIASKFLKPGGLFLLTGASAALGPTPSMVAYGMTKAAIHHLLFSIVSDNTFPKDTRAVIIMPETLDTPSNRAAMPSADFKTWTPPDDISNKVLAWSDGKEKVESGSKFEVKTQGGVTSWNKI